MSTSNIAEPSKHPSALLLPYLEDRLVPEDKALINDHLESCGECARELRQLNHLAHLLTTNKNAFCPESWALYQCVENGVDPDGKIAAHLEHCSLCQEEVVAYKTVCTETALPEYLKDEVARQFRPRSACAAIYDEKRSFAALIDKLKSLFSVPVMALGTAAAAILVAVMLYPVADSAPVIGLSSVAWETEQPRLVPKSGIRLMGPVKPSRSIAIVLFFRDFRSTIPQEQIDDIYSELKPSDSIASRFQIVPPDKVSEALGSINLKPFDRRELMKTLRNKIDVSEVLVVTISSTKRGREVRYELLDVKTGDVIYYTAEAPVAEDHLSKGVRDSAFSLLKHYYSEN